MSENWKQINNAHYFYSSNCFSVCQRLNDLISTKWWHLKVFSLYPIINIQITRKRTFSTFINIINILSLFYCSNTCLHIWPQKSLFSSVVMHLYYIDRISAHCRDISVRTIPLKWSNWKNKQIHQSSLAFNINSAYLQSCSPR